MNPFMMLVVVFAALSSYAGPGRGRAIQRGLPKATVGCFGDSIFAGACGQSVCYQLGLRLPPGYVETNLAVSGETAHQIATRVMAEAATACLGEPCGTYFMNGGVNTLKEAGNAGLSDDDVADLALNGGDGSMLGMLDAIDYLHSTYPRAGVGISGVTPYAGCDNATCPSLVRPGPRAAAYNARLLEACAARPWLMCTFPYAALEDPENSDHIRPAIACADGIHLLVGGHEAIAGMLYALRTW